MQLLPHLNNVLVYSPRYLDALRLLRLGREGVDDRLALTALKEDVSELGISDSRVALTGKHQQGYEESEALRLRNRTLIFLWLYLLLYSTVPSFQTPFIHHCANIVIRYGLLGKVLHCASVDHRNSAHTFEQCVENFDVLVICRRCWVLQLENFLKK